MEVISTCSDPVWKSLSHRHLKPLSLSFTAAVLKLFLDFALCVSQESFMLQQDPQDRPVALKKSALKKRATVFRSVRQEPEDYTLQVNGRLEFLYGNHPLSQFKVSYCSERQIILCFKHRVPTQPWKVSHLILVFCRSRYVWKNIGITRLFYPLHAFDS